MNKEQNIKVSQQEIEEQKVFMTKINSINKGLDKKFQVISFGCQMSESDAEKISGMLIEMGYTQTEEAENADVVVFNTCCVREHAEEKIFSRLGQLKPIKESKKDMIVVFGGCMAQQEKVVSKIKKSYRHVDILLGTHNVYRFPELLLRAINETKMITEIWDIDGVIPEGLPSFRNDGLKAWVDIVYGCNNFCSYCIVPYVRGRERSRDVRDILNEIEELVKQGYKEITLLGQNVNSYGKGLRVEGSEFGETEEGQEVKDFPDLLKEVCKVEGVERVRFMTSNPKDFSDKLIQAMTDNPKICKHIHLPFQSGSTKILEKMNRKYSKESYLVLIDKIKKAMPQVAITTDIIVGFPGETEEDFLDTLDVVEKVRFDLVYTFIFSKREGTPAATMEKQVEESVKKERFDRLLKKVYKIMEENNQAVVGNIERVMVEGTSKSNREMLSGRTGTNRIVNFPTDGKVKIGDIVDVKIISQHMWYLKGEMVWHSLHP